MRSRSWLTAVPEKSRPGVKDALYDFTEKIMSQCLLHAENILIPIGSSLKMAVIADLAVLL